MLFNRFDFRNLAWLGSLGIVALLPVQLGAICPASPPDAVSVPAGTTASERKNVGPIHGSGNKVAQTFTAPGSGCVQLDSIAVNLKKSNGASHVFLRVYKTTVTGVPDLSEPLGDAIDLGVPNTSSYTSKTASFDPKIQLQGGQSYAFVLSAPDEGNASNQYSAEAKQTSGSPYSGGTVYKGDTSAWEEQDGRDLVMTIVFSCCPSVNGADCTYTQGYWKNHSEAWPVDNLDLGYENYTKEELLSIFNEPVRGNGLISLAHQLIAAELNKAKGATAVDIQTAMNFAHALIGNNVIPPVSNSNSFQHPSITGSYASELDDYNNGVTGPGHCSN